MPALYDKIGLGYDTTRHPDPRIADELIKHLNCATGARVFDLACGSGNYTGLLASFGFEMTGLDLSKAMLAQAVLKQPSFPVVQGHAQQLPFRDGAFDAAVTTLAIHHMSDHAAIFREVRRVLSGGRFVLFTTLPEQTERYWLAHYWPKTVKSSADSMPSRKVLDTALAAAGFKPSAYVPWNTPSDLTDLFWYAGKDRPEIYFDAKVRAGISAFAALCEPDELQDGLDRLRADLDLGRWQNVRAAAQHDLGDYCFVVAEVRG